MAFKTLLFCVNANVLMRLC